MGNPTETPTSLQTDTITTLPVPIRTIQVVSIINGVATKLQQQVVSIADADGNIIDRFVPNDRLSVVIDELREIKSFLAQLLGVPTFDAETSSPGTITQD